VYRCDSGQPTVCYEMYWTQKAFRSLSTKHIQQYFAHVVNFDRSETSTSAGRKSLLIFELLIIQTYRASLTVNSHLRLFGYFLICLAGKIHVWRVADFWLFSQYFGGFVQDLDQCCTRLRPVLFHRKLEKSTWRSICYCPQIHFFQLCMLYIPVQAVSVQWKHCIWLGFRISSMLVTWQVDVTNACLTALTLRTQKKEVESPKLYKYW